MGHLYSLLMRSSSPTAEEFDISDRDYTSHLYDQMYDQMQRKAEWKGVGITLLPKDPSAKIFIGTMGSLWWFEVSVVRTSDGGRVIKLLRENRFSKDESYSEWTFTSSEGMMKHFDTLCVVQSPDTTATATAATPPPPITVETTTISAATAATPPLITVETTTVPAATAATPPTTIVGDSSSILTRK